MPPSKLIVTNNSPPRGGCLLGGVNYEGGRSNQKSFFLRRVIVPLSKLIVTKRKSPKGELFIRGVIIWGEIIHIYVYIYIYVYVYVFTEGLQIPIHVYNI